MWKTQPLGPQTVALFENQVFNRNSQVKMRSLGQSLTQWCWCLYNMKPFGQGFPTPTGRIYGKRILVMVYKPREYQIPIAITSI